MEKAKRGYIESLMVSFTFCTCSSLVQDDWLLVFLNEELFFFSDKKGKIGFADLARTISKRWNACDAQTRAYFESHALVEKRGYEKELKVYRNNLREKTSSKEEGTKESDTETVEIVNEPDVAKSKANKGCTNPALTNLIHSTHSLSCSENLEPLPFNQFASTDLIELDQETCDYVVTVFGTARKS